MATNKEFFVRDGLKVSGNTLLNGTTYSDAAQTKLHVKTASNGASANLSNTQGLLIENSGTSSSNYALKLATGSGNIFSVSNNGHVGIGSLNTSTNLNIFNDSDVGNMWLYNTCTFNGTTNGSNTIYFGHTADSVAAQIGHQDTSSAIAGGGDTLMIHNHGPISFSSEDADASSTSDIFVSGGNVGIGTTDPTQKLHVNGLTQLGDRGKTEGGAVISYASFGEVKSGAHTLLGNAVVPGTTNNTIQHSKTDPGNYIRLNYTSGIAFHTNITNTVDTDVAISSSNERMRIDLDGNVGINTTNPTQKLHVNGLTLLDGLTQLGDRGKTEGGAVINYASFGEVKGGAQTLIGNAVVPGTTNNTIQHSKSDAGNYIRLHYTSGIAFHTNITNTVDTDVTYDTNERVRIDLDGNVGIGTTDPDAALHVKNDTGIKLSNSNGDSNNIFVPGANGLEIQRGNGDTAIGIKNDNNYVGIGKTDPDYKLDVNGSFRATLDGYINDTLYIGEYIQFNDQTELGGLIYKSQEGSSFSNRYALRFDQTNNASFPYLTNRAPSGKVVIKTGTAAGGAENTHFTVEGGDGTVDAYFENANVGIGTAAPDSIFHVYSDVSAMLKMQSASGNNDIGFDFFRGADRKWQIRNNANDDSLYIIPQSQTDADSAFTILSGGNVGIGTTDPAAKLNIAGDVLVDTGYSLFTDTVDEDRYNETTGNGGIAVNAYNFNGGSAGPNIQIANNYSSGWANIYTNKIDAGADVTNAQNRHISMYTDGSRAWDFNINSTDDLAIVSVQTGNLLLDPTGAGNVGIGITNPDTLLNMQGDSPKLAIQASSGNPEIQFRDGSTDEFSVYYDTGNKYLGFTEDGVGTHMAVKDGGNVGVGTTDPAATLDVRRNASSTPGLIARANRDGAKMNFAYTDETSMGEIGSTYYNADGGMRLWIGSNLNSNSSSHTGPTIGCNVNASWYTVYNSNLDEYQVNRVDSVTTKTFLHINSDGNVGVGTTNPQAKLHVKDEDDVTVLIGSSNAGGAQLLLDGDANGDGAGGDYALIRHATDGTLEFSNNGTNQDYEFTTGGSNAMKIHSGKNVTIGRFTSANNRPLEVYSSTDCRTLQLINQNNGTQGAGLDFTHITTSPAADDVISEIRSIGTDSSGGNRVGTSIKSVVKGVTTGAVDADVIISPYCNNSAIDGLAITHDSRVGIGTDDPSATLDINGPTFRRGTNGTTKNHSARYAGYTDGGTTPQYYTIGTLDLSSTTGTSGEIEGVVSCGRDYQDNPIYNFRLKYHRNTGTMTVYVDTWHSKNSGDLLFYLDDATSTILKIVVYNDHSNQTRINWDINERSNDGNWLLTMVTAEDASTSAPASYTQVTSNKFSSFLSNGHVGIGTDNPAQGFVQIEGQSLTMNTEGVASDKWLYMRYANKGRIRTDGCMTFETGGGASERMRIENGGNVIVNEDGGNQDFRVEAQDGVTGPLADKDYAIFVDASAAAVGIGTSQPSYALEVDGTAHVNGTFTADTKSFLIDHPTREGYMLRYGCLEGPEHAVYVRGTGTNNVIVLPDYWTGLVDEDTITVSLTPKGKFIPLFVEEIVDNTVIVGGLDVGDVYDYTIYATRKDVDPIEVEFLRPVRGA